MRCIIHVDMDAFYASVEQRDRKELCGKPVIVGGAPESRGVVAAASYEARACGVHSAMPSREAYRLCPHGIFVSPRMHRYRAVSEQVMEILEGSLPLVESMSLDEAYGDCTDRVQTLAGGLMLARKIQAQIAHVTGLSASVGVGPNKFLAKLACNLEKPRGATLCDAEFVARVLPTLSVRVLPGVGPKTAERLTSIGVRTVAELRVLGKSELERLTGRYATTLLAYAEGEDDRPVLPPGEPHALSVEETFDANLTSVSEKEFELSKLVVRLAIRLQQQGLSGRTLTLKATLIPFRKMTRQVALPRSTSHAPTLMEVAQRLLRESPAAREPVRLLGLGASNLVRTAEAHLLGSVSQKGVVQLSLPFDTLNIEENRTRPRR